MTRSLASFADGEDLPLLTVQQTRTDGVQVYRPHAPAKPKPTFDWAALTPACTSCGQKSSKLNRDDHCPTCVAAKEPPQEAATGKPTTRRSAPRATSTSENSRRARDAGASTTTGKTRQARAGNAPRWPAGRPGKPVDERRIVEDYKAGQSSGELARAWDVTPKRIRMILDRHNVERRDDRKTRSGGRPRTYNDATVAEVRRLYIDEGLSKRHVAQRLGLEHKTVATIMTRYGIPARQQQGGGGDHAVGLKAQIAALAVPIPEIKQWALHEGLITMVGPGLPSRRIVEAYAAAHAQERAS